jgi:hypothetical protein
MIVKKEVAWQRCAWEVIKIQNLHIFFILSLTVLLCLHHARMDRKSALFLENIKNQAVQDMHHFENFASQGQ